jgi:hypothetical protein
MRPFFENAPDYVFKELFYAHDGFFKTTFMEMVEDEDDEHDIDNMFLEWSDLKWHNKIIDVSIGDFTPQVQELIKERDFGSVNLEAVPDDDKRTLVQRELAAKRTGGHNEPVILLETSSGYDLLEGWHRTMSILKHEPTGAKLNAWIGYGSWTDELSGVLEQ